MSATARESFRLTCSPEVGPSRTGIFSLSVVQLPVSRSAKIDRDRTLVQIGLDSIKPQTRRSGHLPWTYAERQVLIGRHSWSELREILLEESDEGQRLRRSHPFTGIVMPKKRARILANAT